MKKNIHPEYRQVIFHDTTADVWFKIGSTISTNRTIEYEGQVYPYVTIEISSASHPYYTGKQRTVAKYGNAAKFNQRFNDFLNKEKDQF